MKKPLLAFILLLTFTTGAALAQWGNFPDVQPADWFYMYVMEIKDWGIVNGKGDGSFAPNDNINRAEFSKMLSLYDDRVDDKIETAVNGIDIDTSSMNTNSTSNLPTVMYLDKYNEAPADCPSGWEEVSYGPNWEDSSGKKNWKRVCLTDNACKVLYLEFFNQDPGRCPSGWREADYGRIYNDDGRSKWGRACYICQ